jgi:hypothetical protein
VSRRIKIETFTIFEAGSNQVFLEIGPRYNPPQDDTAVLRVGHKTVDSGGISVLLDMALFAALQASLEIGRPWYSKGLQTSTWLSYGTHEAGLEIKWNGSGRARVIMLDPDQLYDMSSWMSDRLMWGWTGWKSGVKSE